MLLLLIFLTLKLSASKVVEVCPDETDCETLSDISNAFDENDMVICFHSGVHNLSYLVTVEDVNNFTFTSANGNATVVVHCTSPAGFVFHNVTGIKIEGITITNCGANTSLSNYMDNDPLLNISTESIASLFLINVQDVALSSVAVSDSSGGFSLMAINSLNTSINSCSFSNNAGSSVGGNVLFVYSNLQQDHLFDSSQLLIAETDFSNGGVSGLIAYMNQSYVVDVTVRDVTAHGNDGSNILYIARGPRYNLLMENVTSSFSNAEGNGGGVKILVDYNPVLNTSHDESCSDDNDNISTIDIIGSSFSHNTASLGAGVYINIQSAPQVPQAIKLSGCNINNNTGSDGIGLYINQRSLTTFGASITYKLENITISHTDSTNEQIDSASVYLRSLDRVYFTDITITDNAVGGSAIINSKLIVSGTILFHNNLARTGGGMQLYGDSYIVQVPPSNITFSNNEATEVGGALYVNRETAFTFDCFYQVNNSNSTTAADVNWTFTNNTAGTGRGNGIYSEGPIEDCTLIQFNPYSQLPTFNEIFDFTNNNDSIASSPTQVCLCDNDNKPNCNINKRQDVFPGEMVTLSLAAVSEYGLSPGVIKIEETNRYSSTLLSTTGDCIEYMYTVHEAPNVSVELNLSTYSPSIIRYSQSSSVNIELSVQYCPFGFSYSPETRDCLCNENITAAVGSSVTCNITSKEITRYGNIWIGTNDNDPSCIIAVKDCPYDYCRSDSVSFNITEPDPQCDLNRAGMLCGNCSANHSLMLGSNECGDCTSYYYIALIIPFAVAGLVLVLLLISLNLTVSVGTINGLIFYANVVKINEHLLFPNGPVPFLSQFIAWLNFDFGIQTCFYPGFDSIAKSWLQFVFPVYTLCLVIISIIACQLSSRFAYFAGRKILPVLATLLILSYTKILRVIISVFQFRLAPCNGTNTHIYWYTDPSVSYTSTTHLILLVFAALVFVCLFLPFTLLLLVYPFCKVKPHKACSRKLCLKLQPFCEAYYGTHKPTALCWTGLLLIARVVMAVNVAVFDKELVISVSIVIVSLILGLLGAARGVYKRSLPDYLECWFLFNLLFLFATINDTPYIAYASTGLAFLTLCGITGYHGFVQIHSCCCKHHGRNIQSHTGRGSAYSSLMSSLVEDVEVFINKDNVPTTIVERYKRRESLLLDSDEKSYVTFDKTI